MIITCAVFRGPRKRATEDTTSARELSHTGIVFTRPFSHLLHSSSQLLTSEVGQTISALCTVGLPSTPCLKSVHRSVMPCSVFPRPMSSAKMHPAPSKSRKPSTHSNMNFTPSRWCGRKNLTSMWSTSIFGLSVSFGFASGSFESAFTAFSGLSSHSTKGSTPGGRGSSAGSAFPAPSAPIGDANARGFPGAATFVVLPHGTNRLRAARRRASSAECPAVAPAKGARNGRASTAAASWHLSPLTIGLRATVSEPESIAWTLRALSSACDSTTGSSSSSAAAAASKSDSEHASEPASESDSAKSDSEASDMVRGRRSDSDSRRANRGAQIRAIQTRARRCGRGGRPRLRRKTTDDAASGFASRSRGGPASAGVSPARARR